MLPPATSPDSQAYVRPASDLYRRVWRWHFYAGLVCVPFLVLMAITGGLYLFQNEITAAVYRDLLQVTPRATARLAPETLVHMALEAQPGTATRYVPPVARDQSVEVGVASASGTAWSVYVDPYSGTPLGAIADRSKLMEIVRSLHSLAIAGTVANHWIEVVAGWAVVLVITGLYLWWPRGQAGGVVTVRQSPVKRLWWRDLHAVTGAFAAVVILFLAITGMPWSAFWGDRFATLTREAGLGMPLYAFGQVPQSTVPLAAHAGHLDVPWTLKDSTVPLSQPAPASRSIGLNAAIARFEQLKVTPGYSISLPEGPRGAYSALLYPDDAAQERVVHLDQYTGATLVDISYRDYGAAARFTEWGISVHTGRQYGEVNRWLMLAGCIAIVLLGISSIVMWWKRRPKGVLGAPTGSDGRRLARGAIAIAAILGLVFPLLGASMLAALAIDALLPRLWRSRWAL